MSNSNKKKVDSQLGQQRTESDAAYNSVNPGLFADYNKSRENAAGLRQTIQDKYTNSNNFMTQKPNASGWFDLPPSSKASMGDYGSARSGYEKLAENGGVNRADFNPALDSYKDFMGGGGIDARALRARGGTTIPSFYENYKNQSQRRANTQGGYSPGFDAQQAELGRQAGREAFNANRILEGDIADKTQQGREFGTTGYGNLMSNITGMEQSGKVAGLGGLTHIGDSETANNQFNTSQNNQMQMNFQDMYQRGGMASAAGLQGLYNSAPGDVGQAFQHWLQSRQGQDNNRLANTGFVQNQKGIDWGKLLSGAASAAGTAAMFM